jgi:hypothetical protein
LFLFIGLERGKVLSDIDSGGEIIGCLRKYLLENNRFFSPASINYHTLKFKLRGGGVFLSRRHLGSAAWAFLN